MSSASASAPREQDEGALRHSDAVDRRHLRQPGRHRVRTGRRQAGAAAGPSSSALAIATILLSWTFVHTIFSFHYAHEYYGERRDGILGGLNFPATRSPDYRDFLYFSLVIGMTSQVSDVADLPARSIRRVAAMHGVLSFFFNLVVLALTVNMIVAA